MDPAPTLCPACARPFRNKNGLGGHLTTVSDAAHESYRAAHGLPAKTPKARISQAKKEAKTLAAPNPAPSRPSPTVPVPHPASPPPPPPIATDPAPQDPPPAHPSPTKGDGLRSALQVAIEDYRRQTAAAQDAPKSKAKKPRPAATDEKSAIMSDASGALAGAGIAAGVIGLVQLIGSLKGAKKPAPKPPEPTPATFYGLPAPPPPPKPQDMPPWMSSLNGSMPLPGGLPPGQQREWWWL